MSDNLADLPDTETRDAVAALAGPEEQALRAEARKIAHEVKVVAGELIAEGFTEEQALHILDKLLEREHPWPDRQSRGSLPPGPYTPSTPSTVPATGGSPPVPYTVSGGYAPMGTTTASLSAVAVQTGAARSAAFKNLLDQIAARSP